MYKLVVYVCEGCNTRYTHPMDAIHCEQSHGRRAYKVTRLIGDKL